MADVRLPPLTELMLGRHGIQSGGIGSAFGIVGSWSSSDHDDAGPNGPFWYWPHGAMDKL